MATLPFVVGVEVKEVEGVKSLVVSSMETDISSETVAVLQLIHQRKLDPSLLADGVAKLLLGELVGNMKVVPPVTYPL